MKKLVSISLLSLYLLFNLGLSFNIHECENGNVELGVFSFFSEEPSSEANKCCHHNGENEPKCNCEDFIVFLELSDPQITASLPSFEGNTFFINSSFIHDHIVHLKNGLKKETLIPPPPLISTYKRVNSTQQLLFYA